MNSDNAQGELGTRARDLTDNHNAPGSVTESGLQPTSVPTVSKKSMGQKAVEQSQNDVVIELPTGRLDDSSKGEVLEEKPNPKSSQTVESKVATQEKKSGESVLSLFAKKAPIIAKAVKDMLPIRKDPVHDIDQAKIPKTNANLVKEKKRIHKARGFGGAYGLYKLAESFARKEEVNKAKSLYLSSCQKGYAPACHRYGWHLDKSGNKPNADRFYKLACDRGVLKSCNNLGWNEESRGQHLSARNYYDMACKQNHRSACKNLKRLRKKANIGH